MRGIAGSIQARCQMGDVAQCAARRGEIYYNLNTYKAMDCPAFDLFNDWMGIYYLLKQEAQLLQSKSAAAISNAQKSLPLNSPKVTHMTHFDA